MDPKEQQEQTELLANIGLCLMQVQMVERVMKQTLLFVIQSGAILDLAEMQKQADFLDKKTLGRLVRILKDRADLDEHFDELLRRFIANRNVLAHNLDEIEGYDLQTPKGRAIGNTFVARLLADTQKVLKIFLSLNVDWSDQTGIANEFNDGIRELIGRDYQNIADHLFFEKENPDPP